MMETFDLAIPLRSFWMHGFGEGGGADADLLVARDAEGFPTIRARHVKGLLRVAMRRALAWNWYEGKAIAGADLVADLLGAADDARGALQIPNARIPDRDKRAIGPEHRKALFQIMASTAINERGTAKRASLRRIEATVPLTLVSHTSFPPPSAEIAARYGNGGWIRLIEVALPALDEIGSHRTRGFGRVGSMPQIPQVAGTK